MQHKDLLTTAELAEYLATTPASVAQMRYRGTGPTFIKAGPYLVRYRWDDVQEWLDAGRRTMSGSPA